MRMCQPKWAGRRRPSVGRGLRRVCHVRWTCAIGPTGGGKGDHLSDRMVTDGGGGVETFGMSNARVPCHLNWLGCHGYERDGLDLCSHGRVMKPRRRWRV